MSLLLIPLIVSLGPWISLAAIRGPGEGVAVVAAASGGLSFALTGPLAAALLSVAVLPANAKSTVSAVWYVLVSLPILVFESVSADSVMSYFWPGLPSPNIGGLLYVRQSLTAMCIYAVYFAVIYLVTRKRRSWSIAAAVLLSVGTIALMVVRAVQSGS